LSEILSLHLPFANAEACHDTQNLPNTNNNILKQMKRQKILSDERQKCLMQPEQQ
jgi:hypothetical protein